MPSEIALVALAGIIGLALAGFYASPRPYNILTESARRTFECLRRRPALFAWACGLFAAQEVAPALISYLPAPPLAIYAALLAAQTVIIYALAHVALRLHRGLILGEWAPGVTWGRREHRMAAYVTLCWLALGAFRLILIPAPPTISQAAYQYAGAVLAFLALVMKAALALTGPAASLDDPRPISRALRSFMRQPVALLLIVVAVGFFGDLGNDAFKLFLRPLSPSPVFQVALDVVVIGLMALLLFLSEFAVALALTRIWEDHYEADTRGAAHNFGWS